MDMPLICPNCDQEVAKYIPKLDCFKIEYEHDGQKIGDQSCKLPIKTACGKCRKTLRITAPVTENVRCQCVRGLTPFIAQPYKVRKAYGDWTRVHVPSILASIDCADAVVKCPTLSCATYMFLRAFLDRGEVMTASQHAMHDTGFVENGQLHIRAVDEMPPT